MIILKSPTVGKYLTREDSLMILDAMESLKEAYQEKEEENNGEFLDRIDKVESLKNRLKDVLDP